MPSQVGWLGKVRLVMVRLGLVRLGLVMLCRLSDSMNKVYT